MIGRTKFNIIEGDRDYDFKSLFMAKFKSLNIKAKKLHFLKYEYKPPVGGGLKREFQKLFLEGSDGEN